MLHRLSQGIFTTFVGATNISYDDFCNQLNNINSKIYVIRNKANSKVIASGSIFIEKKFIHNLSSVAHIEDVIVDVIVHEDFRKKKLGKIIMNALVEYAKSCNCYS
jgi:GNAT superfamily N-acetyltransferase